MTKAALNARNMRLFEHAAALAAYHAWTDRYADPTDTSLQFHAIYERARTKHDEATGIDPAVGFFNSLRLFADSARAMDEFKPPAGLHLTTDVYRTYRDFLEMVWYSSDLSPSFAGIRVNPVVHKCSQEPILRQMLLSGALLMDMDSFPDTLVPKFVRRRTRSLIGMTAPGSVFTGSKLDGVRARRANLSKSNWDESEIINSSFVRAVLDEATFRNGAIIENVEFDHARMRGTKFSTAPSEASAPPEFGERVASATVAKQATPFSTTDVDLRRLGGEIETELARGEADGTSDTLVAKDDDPEAAANTVHDATPLADAPPVRPPPLPAPRGGQATEHEMRFSWTRLKNVGFHGTIAPEIDFSGAILENVLFNLATLTGAKFDGATLTGIDFSYADLTGASFKGAIFRGRIKFSASTKITLDQLMDAQDATIAIAEWHRVFSGPGSIDRRSPPSSGSTNPPATIGGSTPSAMSPQQNGAATTAMPFGILPMPNAIMPYGLAVNPLAVGVGMLPVFVANTI